MSVRNTIASIVRSHASDVFPVPCSEMKHVFRTCQVAFVGFVACTMFLRTRLHLTDLANAGLYLAALFFGLVHMMFNGFLELPLMIFRLPVFYKQRYDLFHPAWAWSVSSWILRVPYSVVEAIVWSCVVYYTIGFGPGAWRFFRYMFALFTVHQMALGLFRTMASIRNSCLSSGMIKPWWIWAFWVSPLSYGQRAIAVNEFGAKRWKKEIQLWDILFSNPTVFQVLTIS